MTWLNMKRLVLGLLMAASPALLVAQQPKPAPPSKPSKPAASKPMSDADLAAAKPGRDPNQAIDEEYTKKIKEYTTEEFFLSPVVDYMPASKTVPTPKAVLGDIAGAPGKLPYSKEVYEYMRLLAKSTPRVRVFTIGQTEEGREMMAVAVASEALMAKLVAENGVEDMFLVLADCLLEHVQHSLTDEVMREQIRMYAES